ncbi:unnamed protein product [Arctogadus glacialis]
MGLILKSWVLQPLEGFGEYSSPRTLQCTGDGMTRGVPVPRLNAIKPEQNPIWLAPSRWHRAFIVPPWLDHRVAFAPSLRRHRCSARLGFEELASLTAARR